MADCLWPCTLCGGETTYVNLGPNYWAICDKCRVCWLAAVNPFSRWREETEEDWQRNVRTLRQYTVVAGEGASARLGPNMETWPVESPF